MSVIIQQCLDTAIGLSQTDCPCFDENKPVDYAVSDSGLYLDELDGIPLNVIDAAEDCANGNVWQIMEKARREAAIVLKGDVNIGLAKIVLPSRPFFNGNIGDVNPKGYIDTASQYAGITWLSGGMPSGTMHISKIRLAINTTVAKTVTLYSSDQDVPLGSFVINCVQNTYSEVSVNIDLPLVNSNGGCIRYWLVYDKTGVKPMKTTLTCGCGTGNSPVWNGLNYLYPPRGNYKSQYAWFEWVNVAGTNGNDVTAKTGWGCSTTYTYGLQIEVSFKCALSDVICQNLDYEKNPAAIKLAEALRYKAGEKVINNIMSSGTINRYTLLDNESMWGRRNHYAKRYTESLAEAIGAMDITRTGCYKCKPGPRIVTI